MKELLRHPYIDVNKQDIFGDTALMLACYNGHTDIMKELLRHPNIDVNKEDEKGLTALWYACIGGHIDIVKELLYHPNTYVDVSYPELGEERTDGR